MNILVLLLIAIIAKSGDAICGQDDLTMLDCPIISYFQGNYPSLLSLRLLEPSQLNAILRA
jgi:hypothetical protein